MALTNTQIDDIAGPADYFDRRVFARAIESATLAAQVERATQPQPVPHSQFGSPELGAMILARCVEKDQQPQPVQEQCPECDGTGTVAGSQAHFPCPICTSPQPQPQPMQEPLAWQSIESMAAERYKVVLSHQSMFYRYAVVAGNGAQQLYIGRETECANMARKFAGAFLDGAHVVRYLNNTSPQAQPLSNEQITKLPVWRHFVGLMPEHHVEITRAIEQAHGITKGKT